MRASRTNSRNRSEAAAKQAAGQRSSQASKSSARTPSTVTATTNIEFELDSELLDPGYNQTRKPKLPSGIVINETPSGILIPVEQLEAAGWLESVDDAELTTRELGENEVTGLLLTEARLLVLAFVPEYIRYKDEDALIEHGEDPALALSIIGAYEDHRQALNKKVMEVCSEHALMFLDDDNQPLHTVPIVVRFKNVALWSFKSAREDYYRKLEKAFAQFAQVRLSGKSDKWRSLGVLDVEFRGEKEGEGKNKSWCCKTEVKINPTVDNFPNLFLGTPQTKTLIWELHDEITGFVETDALPALPAGEPVKALSNGKATPDRSQHSRSIAPSDTVDDDEDDFIEAEATAVTEDDFDLDDDELEDFGDD